MLVVLGVLVAIAAFALGARELRTYRSCDGEGDLFVYTRSRLGRRMFGLGVIVAIGATLAVWDIAPPDEPRVAGALVIALLAEIGALVVIAILDLRETSKTAAANQAAASRLSRTLNAKHQK